jgi:hypothetical protein
MEPAEDEDGGALDEFNAYRGVVMLRKDGSLVTYPPTLHSLVSQAVIRLDVPLAITMSSAVTATLLKQLRPDQTSVGDPQTGINMPVIDSITSLAEGKVKIPQEFFICFCKQEQLALVWGDSVRLPSSLFC